MHYYFLSCSLENLSKQAKKIYNMYTHIYLIMMVDIEQGCCEIKNNEFIIFSAQQLDLHVGINYFEANPNKILVAFVSPLEKENQRLIFDSEEIVLEYNKYYMIEPKRTSEFTITTTKDLILNLIWGNLNKKMKTF